MQYVKNEWIKVWSQKNAWIMLGIVLALIILVASINKYYDDAGNTKEEREQDNTEIIKQNQEWMNQPGMDAESKQYHEEEIAILQYRIDHDLPSPYKVTFKDQMDTLTTLSTLLINIFGVVIAAGIVSSEFASGTIKMLLTRPVARWKILLSKLVTSILYSIALLVIAYAVSAILSAILFGTDAGVSLSMVDGQVVENAVESTFWKDLLLALASLIMTLIFAFMIGSLFGSSTLAVSLALFILLMGQTATMFLANYDFTKYIWFAHDLSYYEGGGASILQGVDLSYSIIVNIIYAIIFLAFTFIYFMRRDVTA